MLTKKELRIKAKNIRKKLDIKEISRILCEKLREKDFYKNAKNILLYYPLPCEIDVIELLKDKKNFYLPRVSGEILEICPYQIGDQLKESVFKTKEPTCERAENIALDLIVTPALMTDENNYRLGYGKGYYDRLIASVNAKTVTLIPKELTVKKLPIEPHDIPVDYMITN